MILLVTGGRAYVNRTLVFETLDAIHTETPATVLLNGGADGADALAYQWARSRAVRVRTFVADWRNHGPAAGPMRNTEMVAAGPMLVVAFPGGRGTADCVRKARAKDVRVVEIRE